VSGRRILQVAAASAALVACSNDTGSGTPGPDVVVETLGDTTVIRTILGSVWGTEATLVPEVSIGVLDGPEEYLFGSIYSIAVDDEGQVYVLDGQARNIRVFDSDGAYIEMAARRGEGPGELSNAFSVVVLPDGRIIAHEPADMRVKVLGPEPRDHEQWTYPPGAVVLPVQPLRIDRNGHVLVAAASSSPAGGVRQYVLAMDSDGQLLDSLAPPGGGFEPPSLQFRLPFPIRGRSTTSIAVPLTARRHWTMNSNGEFLTGVSTDYRIDLWRDDAVLRIEREYEPVATSVAERDYHRERTVQSIRRTQPDWNWTGPAVPDTKPPFTGIVAGRDGRIWVQLSTEAQPVVNDAHDPDNPRSEPVTWESPVRYDAFEPDGTYLGTLGKPKGFLVGPAEPIFDGDHVWSVTRDESGGQRVVRYRIAVGGS